MLIQIRSKSVQMAKSNFSRSVLISKRKLWHFVKLKRLGKFYGDIEENSFWISTESFVPVGVPPIIFYGTIQAEDNGVYIKGNFRYGTISYMMILLFGGIMAIILSGNKPTIISFCFSTIIIAIILLIYNLLNYKRVNEIIKFIREL